MAPAKEILKFLKNSLHYAERVFRVTEIEPELAFFQVNREFRGGYAVEFGEPPFREASKGFDAVHMVLSASEPVRGMEHPVVVVPVVCIPFMMGISSSREQFSRIVTKTFPSRLKSLNTGVLTPRRSPAFTSPASL